MGFFDSVKKLQAWGMAHQPKQKQVTYEGERKMRRGVAAMERQGWHVVTTTAYQPRAGLGRIVTLGVGAAVFPPKTKFTVTFSRE